MKFAGKRCLAGVDILPHDPGDGRAVLVRRLINRDGDGRLTIETPVPLLFLESLPHGRDIAQPDDRIGVLDHDEVFVIDGRVTLTGDT